MILKTGIRKEIFKYREKNSITHFNYLNEKLYNNFSKIEFLRDFKNEIIAGYLAFSTECNIFNILNYYSKFNTITLPSIPKINEKMEFREWNCVFDNLKENILFKKMRLLEPTIYCKKLQPSIVFLPAVAVDIFGNRVGYGAGYYDKTLSNINCLKIAVVFDFQIFNDEIENEINDVKMDFILTESKFIKIPRI